MKKVIVVAGPTASGKSAFAVELAKRMNTEIISGDSIQVYRGLNIGSGKITKEEMQGIPHHLLDILSPKDPYSVADFQRMAREILEEKEKPCIICGGTGLYLKACLYDYDFLEEEGDSIEEELEKYSNEELYERLKEIDSLQAEKIHRNNRKRLLRSLTIYIRSGETKSELESRQQHQPIYDAFIVGCTMDKEILYNRINTRVLQMVEDGLEEEVKGLLKEGITFADWGMQGIGYKEWKEYFEGDASKEEVIEAIQTHTRQFAKRQYTWFNHQMDVKWMDMNKEEEVERRMEEIIRWGE